LNSANDVTLTNGSFFGNGVSTSGSGLELTADSAVSLTNVTANSNGLYGLSAVAGKGMTLQNITTSNNQFGTALVSAPGTDITLTNGQFTNNDVGLFVSNVGGSLPEAYDPECDPEPGTITLTNIVASYNHEQGAIIKSAGEVILENTDFSYNGTGSGLSIFMTAPGTVSVYNMRAAGNAGNGMEVWAGLSGPETYGGGTPLPTTIKYEIIVACGAFTGNGGYGFYLDGNDAQSGVAFNTDYFNGNGTAPYYMGDAAFLEENLLDCYVVVEPPDDPLRTVNVHVVPVGGDSQPVLLDCVHYSGTILVLPNGDKVTYYCPTSGTVTTGSVLAEDLPGDLDAGLTYLSALETSLDDGGLVSLLPDGRLRVTFTAPEGADADSLAILYWDPALNSGAGAWVELPAAVWNTSLYDPTDGKMIFVGPYLNPENEFETIVNFTGTFVLVQK
jgi:hypothetical protein